MKSLAYWNAVYKNIEKLEEAGQFEQALKMANNAYKQIRGAYKDYKKADKVQEWDELREWFYDVRTSSMLKLKFQKGIHTMMKDVDKAMEPYQDLLKKYK